MGNSNKAKQENHIWAWVWLVAGMGITGLIAFMLYLPTQSAQDHQKSDISGNKQAISDIVTDLNVGSLESKYPVTVIRGNPQWNSGQSDFNAEVKLLNGEVKEVEIKDFLNKPKIEGVPTRVEMVNDSVESQYGVKIIADHGTWPFDSTIDDESSVIAGKNKSNIEHLYLLAVDHDTMEVELEEISTKPLPKNK